MNKAKQMQKQLVRRAVIAGGVVAVSVGAMIGTGSWADSTQQRKTTAEGARSSANSQIDTMKNQISKSGDAEKRFIDIALGHNSNDYSASTDALKAYLRTIKEQYRFSDSFKLTLATDKPSDKAEFKTLNFDVTVREPMKLDFSSMSDMHVYSFLQSLEHDMPGFVRISKFHVLRKADFNSSTYRDMAGGATPETVDATIEFSWIGLEPKPDKKAGAAGAAGTPAPGADPMGNPAGRPGGGA